jgi:hypothetical protein
MDERNTIVSSKLVFPANQKDSNKPDADKGN